MYKLALTAMWLVVAVGCGNNQAAPGDAGPVPRDGGSAIDGGTEDDGMVVADGGGSSEDGGMVLDGGGEDGGMVLDDGGCAGGCPDLSGTYDVTVQNGATPPCQQLESTPSPIDVQAAGNCQFHVCRDGGCDRSFLVTSCGRFLYPMDRVMFPLECPGVITDGGATLSCGFPTDCIDAGPCVPLTCTVNWQRR
jgi:hypothetical protein